MDHCFSQSPGTAYVAHGAEGQVASVPLLCLGAFSSKRPQCMIVPFVSTSPLGWHLQEGRLLPGFTHHLSLLCLAQKPLYNRCSVDIFLFFFNFLLLLFFFTLQYCIGFAIHQHDIFHCKNKTKGLLENKNSH